MNNETDKILDNILNRMDDETKNILIKALITHDKKDISIQAIPVYEDVCHEGHVLMRYIKEIKYGVSIKEDINNQFQKEYHAIWLGKDEDNDIFKDIIDSEIKRITDEYVKMGTTYKMWSDGGYSDLLRADGALRELEELKRKIHDNT